MTLPSCETLILDNRDDALFVTLNRPEKRNAMNGKMVQELSDIFDAIADDRTIRAVVLRGAAGTFCSGGDISDMNTRADNAAEARANTVEFNRSFGRMITKVDHAPQVVIAVLEGAVLGGGFGLACISDVAIAAADVKMGMPETGLGIAPAQIAPFVVKRIGFTQARRLALLGDWVNGPEACALGIVHFSADNTEALEARLAKTLKKVRRAAPVANAVTKKLMHQVADTDHEKLLDIAAGYFADALAGDEGKEGTRAFLEKRLPSWAGE